MTVHGVEFGPLKSLAHSDRKSFSVPSWESQEISFSHSQGHDTCCSKHSILWQSARRYHWGNSSKTAGHRLAVAGAKKGRWHCWGTWHVAKADNWNTTKRHLSLVTHNKKKKENAKWELWVTVYCVTNIISPCKVTWVQSAAFLL